ncbi:hypothetical protein [Morganella morganii]|uniref:hypothetical protein n=1 Tax=Morganella morganii TaxID=582 RepID=UPI00062C6A5A|nr:hypothetical protein [Morganella morganii]EJD6109650.1 hypothetical protein [Morganella morganii]EKU4014265.1 hypothetical protein [Morganella morganii]ELA7777437.1 hypothetical protein [Morganella morganii]KKY64236.1 hypothetical protein OA40_16425 [Morganella morganii]MBT0404016.1 hypothetical protein [Morganella morganii subsp. morganii]
MNRAQLLYQIYYSYRLHTMFSVLLGRIDKTLSFLLLLLGSSVIGNIGNHVFIGICIAIITSIRMAFSFEKASESARKQAMSYLNLYTSKVLTIPEDQLIEKLMSIQASDSNVWISLVSAAEIRTRLTFDEPIETTLSFWEKFMAFLSGDLPKVKK